MDYNKYNKYIGWALFTIAAFVYFATMERSVSLWDCGEYAATSYKLEVGHPPGAPLYQMINRVLSAFVGPQSVALVINMVSALSSAFTILFLFWTITAIAKKLATSKVSFGRKKDDSVLDEGSTSTAKLNDGQMWAILGSGIVGSLVYTFTDSFWFSAVEAEVYAMSSFFTALVFWAMYKWDEEMERFENGESKRNPDYWIVFILFMVGLSIGVHLLNLLAIPAMGFLYYFRKAKKPTLLGFAITGISSFVVLQVIQTFIIPGTAKWIAGLEIYFVNSLHMPFGSGMIMFFILLIGVLAGGIIYSRKKDWVNVNTAFVSLTALYIGYSCFAMIPIRSNADLPIDENNPENAVALESYLLREQYGDRPLFKGPQFTSIPNDQSEYEGKSDVYVRRFVVKSGDEQLEGFKSEEDAQEYIDTYHPEAEIVEEYYLADDREFTVTTYPDGMEVFLPRMYSSDDRHIDAYKMWSGYPDNPAADPDREPTMVGSRKVYMPTSSENRRYFFDYQFMHMYWRYFMWNFSGRQNDDHNQNGDLTIGNWQSGLNFIDRERLGDQSTLPEHRKANYANNKYFLLPLLLGLIGLLYHAYRHWQDWWVVMLLFIFTGFLVVFYLNQKPMEPRERDYAYAASFYAFSIWVGLSVYAIYDMARKLNWRGFANVMVYPLGAGVFFLLMEIVSDNNHTMSYSVLYMTLVFGGVLGLMMYLKNIIKEGKTHAMVITGLLTIVPIIMGVQNWDDHDRSGRFIPRETAKNYLKACDEQAVLFTNGDNDTFPLWYIQEVEEFRTDIRTVNLSLANTDWYIEQTTRRMYDSDPLPVSFKEYQYRQGAHLDFAATPAGVMHHWLNALVSRSENPAYQIHPDLEKAVSLSLKYSPGGCYSALATYLENPGYEEFRNRVFGGLAAQLKQYKGAKNESVNLKEALGKLAAKEWIFPDPSKQGKFVSYIPYRSYTVEVTEEAKQSLLGSEAVPADSYDRMVDELQFSIGKSHLLKADLLILDLVASSNWERPIYFAATGGKSAYVGLDNYFQMEGLVYRLVPIRGAGNRFGLYGNIYSDKMYDMVMNEWDWGNLKGENVLVDYTNRRPVGNFRMQYSSLADQLVSEAMAKIDDKTYAEERLLMAKNVLDKCDEVFPDNKVPFDNFSSVSVDVYLSIADGLDKTGNSEAASQCRTSAKGITEILVKYTQDDFNHFKGFEWRMFTSDRSMDDVAQQLVIGYTTLERISQSYQRHLIQTKEGPALEFYEAELSAINQTKNQYLDDLLIAVNTKIGEVMEDYSDESILAQKKRFATVAQGFFFDIIPDMKLQQLERLIQAKSKEIQEQQLSQEEANKQLSMYAINTANQMIGSYGNIMLWTKDILLGRAQNEQPRTQEELDNIKRSQALLQYFQQLGLMQTVEM